MLSAQLLEPVYADGGLFLMSTVLGCTAGGWLSGAGKLPGGGMLSAEGLFGLGCLSECLPPPRPLPLPLPRCGVVAGPV